MPIGLFPAKYKTKPQLLKDATISDFSGGLNLVDNDLTMRSKYAKILTNWVQGTDGSLQLRWGTKLFCDISSMVDGTLIETVYFNSYILAFTTEGEIAKVDSSGTVTVLWNDAVAAALSGAPSGWTTGAVVGSIDTTEFKGELIIVNGVDKPLIVHRDMTVEYLNDPATGSNVNVPIGSFVTTVSNYVVIGGVGTTTDLYISSQGTSGVWPGDAPPNDSLSLNIGTYVPQNSGVILGIGSFRNFLMVAFDGAIVIVQLGVYDTSGATPVHKPSVQDNIIEHGIINARTTITTKNDFIMADTTGWHTAGRTQFGLVDTNNVSELIDPDYTASVSIDETRRHLCFSVYNKLEHRATTFVANDDGTYTGWVANFPHADVKKSAWSKVEGWSFVCGCNSSRGRVFLGVGTKVFRYGNDVFEDEDYTADFLDDCDSIWSPMVYYPLGTRVLVNTTTYISTVNHTSTVSADDIAAGSLELYTGEEITFDWELPWSPVNARALKKFLKYIQLDTTGSAVFTVDVYCDNFYKDVDGNRVPQLTMEFVGADSHGFGDGDQPFGGGRRTGDERPWGMPAQFNLMKLRVHGATRAALKIIGITIYYVIGSHRR